MGGPQNISFRVTYEPAKTKNTTKNAKQLRRTILRNKNTESQHNTKPTTPNLIIVLAFVFKLFFVIELVISF